MNFKVNLFFHLYETPFTSFGFPTLIVSRLSGRVGKGGHNWRKKRFALKCISGKIRWFKTIYIFFFQWKIGSLRTHPASWKIPLIFFWNHPLPVKRNQKKFNPYVFTNIRLIQTFDLECLTASVNRSQIHKNEDFQLLMISWLLLDYFLIIKITGRRESDIYTTQPEGLASSIIKWTMFVKL